MATRWTQVEGEESFLSLLRRVQRATLGAYGHQDLPFEKLVEELQPERNLSHNPLFQVMFALQNVPTMDPGPTQPHPQYQDRTKQMTTDKSRFDLSLFMMEKEWGIEAEIEYNLDLFATSTIHRLIGHFQRVLRGVVQDPEQRISDLPLLSAGERQ